MPTYVSREGIFHPAKEKVALVNHSNKTITNPSSEWSKHHGEKVKPGDPFIYEGEDRSALFRLYEQGVSELGMNFRQDPELIARVRQLGFDSIDKYLEAIGYNAEDAAKQFEKEASVVNKHEMPKRVKAIEKLGGGVDTTGGGQDRYGGFGERP